MNQTLITVNRIQILHNKSRDYLSFSGGTSFSTLNQSQKLNGPFNQLTKGSLRNALWKKSVLTLQVIELVKIEFLY